MAKKSISSYELLNPGVSGFKFTNWDRYDYLGLRDYSAKLGVAEEAYLKQRGRNLTQDSFFALMGNEPNDAAKDSLGRAWDDAIQTPQFQELRAGMTDRIGQSVATLKLAEAVNVAITKAERARNNPKQAANGARADQLQLANPGMGREEAEAQAALEAQNGLLTPDPNAGEVQIPGELIEKAAKDASDTAQFVRVLGAGMEGTPGQAMDQAIEVSDLIDVSEFAKMLGWAKILVGGAAREARRGNEELTGYRGEAWGPRTLPHLMLGVAEGDPQAMAQLADNALQARTYRSITPQGKGPVILLRDESGSMAGPPHRKALAFELSLAHAFNQDGRDLVVIRWGGSSAHTSEPFTHGTGDLIAHLRSFFNSGDTRPVPAIKKAIQVADDYVPGADILVLTDGAFSSEQGQNSAMVIKDLLVPFKAQGGRAWAVLIGSSEVTAERNFAGWADGWVAASDIKAGDKLATIVKGMAKRAAAGSEHSGRVL